VGVSCGEQTQQEKNENRSRTRNEKEKAVVEESSQSEQRGMGLSAVFRLPFELLIDNLWVVFRIDQV
jgi:hypothetical protein